MKILLSSIFAGALLFSQAIIAMAASQTFTVSASVPLATSVGITATRVNVASGTGTTVSGTALSFDPMSFDSLNKIWLPDHYFSLDVTPVGGAGSTDVSVTYTDGANPNLSLSGHGLGWKSTSTFVRVNGTTETGLTTHGPKKMLKDLNGEHIVPSELNGGFLRMYLGIVTKDPKAQFPDPAASEVFTNADRPGPYDGSLVITTTVI